MPRILYTPKRFSEASEFLIQSANQIVEEYAEQGYSLTLRQLYYQFVARDLLPNKQKEYKRLGSVISDARLAGRLDWLSIEDRTRGVAALEHWDAPEEIIKDAVGWFQLDRWENQSWRVEVWVEKEALAGVFARVCNELDVPYLSCRGYTSQSEMWRASMRLSQYASQGQDTLILHFGDHDPSGIDMSRDIRDRLKVFGCPTIVKRIALNMDQVEKYTPPPNPAKLSDTRSLKYIREYGKESWELDALEPSTLTQLVRDEIFLVLDEEQWVNDSKRQERARKELKIVAANWSGAVKQAKG